MMSIVKARITTPDRDVRETDDLNNLAGDLNEHHGLAAELTATPRHDVPHSKGSPVETSIAVAIAGNAITAFALVVRSWLARNGARQLHVERDGQVIELQGHSAATEQMLIDFLTREPTDEHPDNST